MTEYSIPTDNVEIFKKTIEKLNKKAVKLGVEPPRISFVDGFTRKFNVHPITGEELVFPIYIDYTVVQVADIAPIKFSGWSFIAQIEHDSDGRSMIFKVPGVELDESYYTNLTNTCDHCGTNRRRKNTYIVRHDNGEEKRVGSTCVRDFLGHATPANVAQRFANIFNYYNAFVSFGNVGEKFEYSVPAFDFYCYTSAVINKFGWLSRKAANEEGGMSTADRVAENIEFYAEPKDRVTTNSVDSEVAGKAIEWAKTLDSNKSDFNYNIKTIAEKKYIKRQHYGFAAALVWSYIRYEEAMRLRAAQNNGLESEYLGEVGVRTTFNNAKLVSSLDINGNFGLTTLYKFLVNEKDVVVWFSTSTRTSIEVDKVYNITGTVKKHNDYNGKKQTILNRVKAVEV